MGGEEQETGKEGQAKRHGKRRAKMLANSQAKRWAKRQWYNTSCEYRAQTLATTRKCGAATKVEDTT